MLRSDFFFRCQWTLKRELSLTDVGLKCQIENQPAIASIAPTTSVLSNVGFHSE